jgi:cobyrinic acid a,c-diamide synthase
MSLSNKTYLIAGTQSGCGKTTATLALMQHLKAAGKAVAPFKSGPDFLDPMWHKVACGRTSYNMDTRMVGAEESKRLLHEKATDADIAIIEGVMGLFDGLKGVGGVGSSAHLAKVLDVPVLLVVSAKGMSGSLVALVEGFVARANSMDVCIAGVIANHVGSENHANILRELLVDNDLPPLLAWLNKDAPTLPERHLGLKMPCELDLPDFSDCLHVKQEFTTAPARGGLLASGNSSQTQSARRFAEKNNQISQLLCDKKIAVAKDAAFCFIYPANIEWLQSQGAEVAYFSPLAGEEVPQNADVMWLPGGYPELHLLALEQSTSWASVCNFIESDKPVLAECGGMMILGQSITDKTGETAQMANILPCSFSMQDKLAGLGYRAEESGVTGHEFHHSKRESLENLQPCFEVNRGDTGIRHKKLRASYIHWYFSSQPDVMAAWLGAEV